MLLLSFLLPQFRQKAPTWMAVPGCKKMQPVHSRVGITSLGWYQVYRSQVLFQCLWAIARANFLISVG